jgi:hypothetical protein
MAPPPPPRRGLRTAKPCQNRPPEGAVASAPTDPPSLVDLVGQEAAAQARNRRVHSVSVCSGSFPLTLGDGV